MPICSKRNCFFYGGDLNPNDQNAVGFSNENTLFISDSFTYAPVTPTQNETVHAIFFNVQVSAIPTKPFTGSYNIRTGIAEGNGGTIIQGAAGFPVGGKNTGRSFIGVNEFSVVMPVNPPVQLQAGTTYWFNVTVECLDSSDANCSSGRMFASNTTQNTNGINADWQPSGQMFFESLFFGFNWANWCDSSLGLNSQQCAQLSFGLY